MKFLRRLFSLQMLMSLVVLSGCMIIAYFLVTSRASVKKTRPEPRPTLVETLLVSESDVPVRISAYGTVQANRETNILTQVGGRVVSQSPNLVIGGLLEAEQVIIKIDPRDYEIAISQAKAMVEKAEFELQVEKGRQLVAQREWELLDPTIKSTEIGKSLALREPHLREKVAALEGAKSQLEKARLDRSRTIIRAPFNAIVTEETVEPGDLLNPQTKIAKLAATDEFRIKVSIPYDQLRWITIPKKGEKGSPVTIVQEIGYGQELTWEGAVVRLLGDVDPQGRMVRVLVVIHDPLGLRAQLSQPTPLLLGTYVRVDIHGPLLKDVFPIPRKAMRQGNLVWVKTDDDTLEVKKIHVLFRQQDTVLIDEGLDEGDQVIISNLATPIDGMALRELFEEDD